MNQFGTSFGAISGPQTEPRIHAALGCLGLLLAAPFCSVLICAVLSALALSCSGSGLLWTALGWFGLLWAALDCLYCSELLCTVSGCSSHLWPLLCAALCFSALLWIVLRAALRCSALLWAAMYCLGLAALRSSCLLQTAVGCFSLLWAAVGCSGLLFAALVWACFALSKPLQAVLGPFRGHYGLSGPFLEPSRGHLGAIMCPLGAILAIWGPSWSPPGAT